MGDGGAHLLVPVGAKEGSALSANTMEQFYAFKSATSSASRNDDGQSTEQWLEDQLSMCMSYALDLYKDPDRDV